MTTFNHAFSLGFACPNSQYEDAEEALVHEKDKIISALLIRVQELLTNTDEFRQACEPFDTFEETSPTNRHPQPTERQEQ